MQAYNAVSAAPTVNSGSERRQNAMLHRMMFASFLSAFISGPFISNKFIAGSFPKRSGYLYSYRSRISAQCLRRYAAIP